MFWALSSESLAATTPDCLELLQLMVAALLRVEGGKGEDVGSAGAGITAVEIDERT